jgi:hypothetical protein
LATERYVSIIDKAIARKLVINGGPSAAPSRSGELSPDGLLAVALVDGGHLPHQDVQVLAQACDIPVSDLELDSSMVSVPSSSP